MCSLPPMDPPLRSPWSASVASCPGWLYSCLLSDHWLWSHFPPAHSLCSLSSNSDRFTSRLCSEVSMALHHLRKCICSSGVHKVHLGHFQNQTHFTLNVSLLSSTEMLWNQQDPMGKAGVWLGQVSFIFLWPYASPHGLQETSPFACWCSEKKPQAWHFCPPKTLGSPHFTSPEARLELAAGWAELHVPSCLLPQATSSRACFLCHWLQNEMFICTLKTTFRMVRTSPFSSDKSQRTECELRAVFHLQEAHSLRKYPGLPNWNTVSSLISFHKPPAHCQLDLNSNSIPKWAASFNGSHYFSA